MNWLEISLTLSGELAEAVADILARYAYQGVSIESTQIESNPDDEGRPVGPVRVRAYLPADDTTTLEETRNRIEHDLFYLGMIQPLPTPTYTPVADADWAELWKANYHPVRIGRRLAIIPAWLADRYKNPTPAEFPSFPLSPSSPSSEEDSKPSQLIPLLMDPGMAFGTGTHPTTQLCLALLETYLKPGDSVFDVGCGSGILSVAAAKLGAGRILGVDIDREADRATRENSALNGVSDQIEFHQGSIEVVTSPNSPRANLQFPLVLANILARIIIKLFGEGLAQPIAPGGHIILSGILVEQAEQVCAAAQAAGLTIVEQQQSGDWVAIVARKPNG